MKNMNKVISSILISSMLLTPVSTTTELRDGERVIIYSI